MTKDENDNTLRLFDRLVGKEKELARILANRHAEMESCNSELIKTVEFTRSKGWVTHEKIWNASLYLNSVAYDLSHHFHELVYERNPWKRNLAARSLSTLMYEIGKNITTVFGKDFRGSCEKLNVSKNLQDTVNKKKKEISKLWNMNKLTLYELRNAAGAHREKDALKLNEVIESIDIFELMGVGVEMGRLLNEFGQAVQPIITETSSTKPPEIK